MDVELKNLEQISTALKSYRRRKKITQDRLASFANVSRKAISELENGHAEVKLSTVLKILKVVNIRLKLSVPDNE